LPHTRKIRFALFQFPLVSSFDHIIYGRTGFLFDQDGFPGNHLPDRFIGIMANGDQFDIGVMQDLKIHRQFADQAFHPLVEPVGTQRNTDRGVLDQVYFHLVVIDLVEDPAESLIDHEGQIPRQD